MLFSFVFSWVCVINSMFTLYEHTIPFNLFIFDRIHIAAEAETEAQLAGDTADLKSMDSSLAEVTTVLADTRQDCQSKADEFEAER